MSVKKVIKYGDPILREVSKEVHKVSKKIQILIDDLIDTMYAQNGVGLAAPQIGVNLRVFVIDVSEPDKAPEPRVFVNPKIIKRSGAMSSREGCLSFPDAYTDVRRYSQVTVKALDSKGKPFILEANNGDLLTRAIQHEFDHLDGILFIDHCRNRFEAQKVLQEKGLGSLCIDKMIDEQFLEDQICSLEKKGLNNSDSGNNQ